MLSLRSGNIAFRTAHIGAMGILTGGHAFDVPKSQLVPYLWATVITGVALGAVEAWGGLSWFHQLRGLMTMGKLGLLCAVPFLWEQPDCRLGVMIAVVVIASVGSHMTARLRYYSVIYREVLPSHQGPGVAELNAKLKENENGPTTA